MGDVLTFTPRPKPVAPTSGFLLNLNRKSLAGPELRASLEEAAQTALDAADRIIAVLDRMDGDTDLEDGGDAEPSLAAPENITGSQVVYMRGGDQDREEEALEIVLPEMPRESVSQPSILPWIGRGNVLTACGTLLLDLVGG